MTTDPNRIISLFRRTIKWIITKFCFFELQFFKKIHKFALWEFMPYALGFLILLVWFLPYFCQCVFWLLQIFSRSKSCIRQEPSVILIKKVLWEYGKLLIYIYISSLCYNNIIIYHYLGHSNLGAFMFQVGWSKFQTSARIPPFSLFFQSSYFAIKENPNHESKM